MNKVTYAKFQQRLAEIVHAYLRQNPEALRLTQSHTGHGKDNTTRRNYAQEALDTLVGLLNGLNNDDIEGFYHWCGKNGLNT